jgi:hypothetical protein
MPQSQILASVHIHNQPVQLHFGRRQLRYQCAATKPLHSTSSLTTLQQLYWLAKTGMQNNACGLTLLDCDKCICDISMGHQAAPAIQRPQAAIRSVPHAIKPQYGVQNSLQNQQRDGALLNGR